MERITGFNGGTQTESVAKRGSRSKDPVFEGTDQTGFVFHTLNLLTQAHGFIACFWRGGILPDA